MDGINATNTSLNTNLSEALSDSDYCPAHVDSDMIKGLKTTAYLIAMLVSVVGNTLLVAVVMKNRNMQTITNFLIVNMAISDLFLTMFNMPQSIYYIINSPDYTWPSGHWGTFSCKLLPFVQSVSVASSVLSLTAIAVDRFFAIVFPLKMYVTFPMTWVTIVTIWIVSMATSSLFLHVMTNKLFGDGYFCIEVWEYPFDNTVAPKNYTVVLFVMFYLVPLVTMSILYSALIWKLWIRKVPGQHSLENQQRADRSKKKVLKMLITVVVLFAICWLPLYIRQFMIFFDPDVCFPSSFLFFAYFLGHLNSSINPCVYAIFNESFRQGFINIFKTCQCRPQFKVYPFPGPLAADNNYSKGGVPLNGVTRRGKTTALSQVPT